MQFTHHIYIEDESWDEVGHSVPGGGRWGRSFRSGDGVTATLQPLRAESSSAITQLMIILTYGFWETPVVDSGTSVGLTKEYPMDPLIEAAKSTTS
jgi:hypothetical protein